MSRPLPLRRAQKSKRGKFLNRLEAVAVTALHAFPLLYCTPRAAMPGTPCALLHQAYRQEILERLSAMTFLERTAVVFIWPPAMVLWGLGLTIANGAYVAQHFGRSRIRQFVDQMHLAFRHGMPANFFYTYELHDLHNWPHAQEYVLRGHIKGGCRLYKRLYRSDPDRHESAKILNDQLAFHEFCAAHHLPTAQLFAVVSDGVFAWAHPDAAALPPIDLFCKPRKENGGSGAERWAYREGYYHRHGISMVLDAQRLADRLAKLSRRQANHPQTQDLTAGALCTFRLHTMLNEVGDVEHLFAMFRMSRVPERIVDTQDGLDAAVDPLTGMLGPASNSSSLARWMDHHPVTGARITGRRIPFWPEALALVLSTHAKLRSLYMIRWDIAVTEHGPVILEANKSPDIEIEQRLNGPWGNGRFGQLMAHFLTQPLKPAKRDGIPVA